MIKAECLEKDVWYMADVKGGALQDAVTLNTEWNAYKQLAMDSSQSVVPYDIFSTSRLIYNSGIRYSVPDKKEFFLTRYINNHVPQFKAVLEPKYTNETFIWPEDV